jgi:hypothetical protein
MRPRLGEEFMSLIVDAQKIGKKLHRLDIRVDGQFIGEYERAQAADVDRKRNEIQCALELLLSKFKKHGELKVRWVGTRRTKVIYANGVEVGVIPKDCWRKPSWGK